MELIYKEDDLTVRLPYILKDRLKTFLKFTPVLGSRHKGTHIEREYLLILKVFGNIASCYTLGQSLYNGRLADTGFTDEDRIVLCLS